MRQINNFKKWLLKQKLIRAHADILNLFQFVC